MWDGRFLPPVQKHRNHPKTIHPEHLVDHIMVDSIELAEDDDIGLTHLGGGSNLYLVKISFVENPTEKYEYMYESDEYPSEEEIRQAVADDLNGV